MMLFTSLFRLLGLAYPNRIQTPIVPWAGPQDCFYAGKNRGLDRRFLGGLGWEIVSKLDPNMFLGEDHKS